jgi:RecA-family ATPase
VKTLRQVLLGVDTYDWVIPNFLERMERLVFTGGEGVGKTTLCRQIVVLAAAGIHPLTFQPMPPVRVLVVDAENSEKQWRRGVSWMAKTAAREGSVDPTDRIFIKAGKRIDITRGTELAKIHRYIDEYKPDIVYIGPIYKLVPGSLNSDEDAAKLIVALDSLRERNVALIMEAHAGKKTDFGGLRNLEPRGSSPQPRSRRARRHRPLARRPRRQPTHPQRPLAQPARPELALGTRDQLTTGTS